MIESVRGKLIHKDHVTAVVECAGVGYGLNMSLQALASLGKPGVEVFVWVHTHVSQDALRLFGFVDATERQIFLRLVAVNGVGPRLALSILSCLNPAQLARAVADGDKAALVRVAGVGKKTAERLLLELRDRLPVGITVDGAPAPMGLRHDLQSALVNLGFDQKEAQKASQKAVEASPSETDIATLLRDALRTTHKARNAS